MFKIKEDAVTYSLDKYAVTVQGGYYYRVTLTHYARKVMTFTAVGNNNQTVWGAQTKAFTGTERAGLKDYTNRNSQLVYNPDSIGDISETVKIDVIKVMMYSTNKEKNPLTEQGLVNADVYQNGDGVDVSDALSIQKKITQAIDTLPES